MESNNNLKISIMTRVVITEDGQPTGRWFNEDTAVFFRGRSRWDGNNHVSLSTGSQLYNQHLYLTKGGNWIKKNTSRFAADPETHEIISEREATEWLLINEYNEEDDEFKELPRKVQEAVKKEIAALEVE